MSCGFKFLISLTAILMIILSSNVVHDDSCVRTCYIARFVLFHFSIKKSGYFSKDQVSSYDIDFYRCQYYFVSPETFCTFLNYILHFQLHFLNHHLGKYIIIFVDRASIKVSKEKKYYIFQVKKIIFNLALCS